MKKLLFALALLVVLAPVTFAEEATNVETLNIEVAAVEVVEAQPELAVQAEVEDVLDSDGLPLSALEIATEKASAGYECPPYTTYCQQDVQCDAGCGGPGTGACEFGCCRCAW